MKELDIHEAIRGLYQGIFEPEAWDRSLRLLCEASGSANAAMVVFDPVQDRFSVTRLADPVPELFQNYQQHYEAIDPAREHVERLAVGDWYLDAREIGSQAMRRHPFYGEFLREFGLSSIMACLVERRPTYEVYFSLQRGPGTSAYQPEDARALDWAIPHMRSALALRDRTLELTALTQLTAQLVERLSFGVIVAAADGKVLLHNALGNNWIRRLIPPSGSKTGEWTVSRPMLDMLAAACRADHTIPAQAALANGPDAQQARLVVLPLPPQHPLASSWQTPSALISIHTQDDPPPHLSHVLRDLYALTPAEIRLAVLLTTGIGLPEACERLSIRRETGRTQLKAIFTKTGMGTQAQLAHLMTRLAACLGGP